MYKPSLELVIPALTFAPENVHPVNGLPRKLGRTTNACTETATKLAQALYLNKYVITRSYSIGRNSCM